MEFPFVAIAGTTDGRLALRALKAQAIGKLLEDTVWDPELFRLVSAKVLDHLSPCSW